MNDIVLSLGLHVSLVLLGALVIRLSGRQVNPAPLLIGLAIFLLYAGASIGGLMLQSALFPALTMNWLGKVFTIGMALIAFALLPGITRKDIGLTWRQAPGSILPALAMIAIICGFNWTHSFLEGQQPNLSAPRLLFEAIMPGLDEELVFRGVLLALFIRAFGEGPLVLGARFGLAEVVITALFGLGHGLFVRHGVPVLHLETVVVTGLIGAGLMWIRQRSGSLVLPAFAHNLVNVGDAFF